MPKRTDIHTILIIGSGPILIGQACEFDYAGVQACKALRREGYRIVLVNSNPATIMTDPQFADATYVEPLTPDIVEKIIARERPDALLPTVGGQTGLNLAMQLDESGVLERYGVQLIGASPRAIALAEDRQRFKDAMLAAGLRVPHGDTVTSVDDALSIAERIGYPVLVRPSFTLGGSGGGIAYDADGLREAADRGLRASPVHQALIEQSVLGWKEYELEVMRDGSDNFVVVCAIENLDPMGVHTGDSITVAPAMTLTDRELQRLRDMAKLVMHTVGVETGGSNVQFAVNPRDGLPVVIEMNPRVSRSSALASKATGFPIAKIAALLAVGYTLDEIPNDITRVTPASFEPSLDYVVVKIPRWAFEKFPGAERLLGPQMKSVGEVMAIGATFPEAFQKALRGLEIGAIGFGAQAGARVASVETQDVASLPAASLRAPLPDRVFAVAEALRDGLDVDEVAAATGYDPWFVDQMSALVAVEREVARHSLASLPAELLREAKQHGFSDAQLALLLQPDRDEGRTTNDERQAVLANALQPDGDEGRSTNDERHDVEEDAPRSPKPEARAGRRPSELDVRARRKDLGVAPVYRRIDTCAAEFAAHTPYLYSTYATADESDVTDRPKALILGGGPNRIGQGIEFDYCCVHACFALHDLGYETIMVNCNPETVSTDYDIADRLYFEPLTLEDVLNIWEHENRGQGSGVRGQELDKRGQGAAVGAQQSEGGNNDAPDLSRPDSVAEEHGSGDRNIPPGEAISSRGAVRPDQPDPASDDINTREHRGGIWATPPQRVSEPSLNRARLVDGGRNASPDSAQTQIPGTRTGETRVEYAPGDRTIAERSDTLSGGEPPAHEDQGGDRNISSEYPLVSTYRPLTSDSRPPTSDPRPLTPDPRPLVPALVQFGGQTPLNLAKGLVAAGVPIWGTSQDAIDLAEDRGRFGALLRELEIAQPEHGMAADLDEARRVVQRIGYPVLVRPSYVLGGRAMAIVYDDDGLQRAIAEATALSAGDPVLIDHYLEDAFEVDVDAVGDGERIVIGGIMEHVEEAGVHSGDSAQVMPPYKVSAYHLTIIRDETERIGLALGVKGLMNIQYAIKDDIVYVLEVNPRASRTVPFISKATGVPLARVAAQAAAGKTLAEIGLTEEPRLDGFFVKEAVLPFDKFPGAVVALGPEMRSTGEVMGHAASFGHAFAKAELGAGQRTPLGGAALLTVNDFDKGAIGRIARDLVRLGFKLYATRGTAAWLRQIGLPVEVVNKVSEGSPSTVDLIASGAVNLVISTPLGSRAYIDGQAMRAAAIRHGVMQVTTLTGAAATVSAIRALRAEELQVRSLQEHHRRRESSQQK